MQTLNVIKQTLIVEFEISIDGLDQLVTFVASREKDIRTFGFRFGSGKAWMQTFTGIPDLLLYALRVCADAKDKKTGIAEIGLKGE